MAYIDSINQASTAQATGATSANNTDEVLGKEDFLTLLVAQLQNQDPLNPDDPTEFTAQLAQFSSLEQLFNLNDSMDNLVQSNANSDRLSTLNTIGKEVAYQSNSFEFDGQPSTIGYELDGQASSVTLALQLDGQTIATIQGTELDKGTHYLTWDGMTQNGDPAPVGNYKIIVSAKAAEGEVISAIPLVRSEVTGVDLDGEFGGTLITSAGEVSFNTILGVFDKGSPSQATSNTDAETEEESEDSSSLTETAAGAATEAITETVSEEAGLSG